MFKMTIIRTEAPWIDSKSILLAPVGFCYLLVLTVIYLGGER